MKCFHACFNLSTAFVTLCVRVWIEIVQGSYVAMLRLVTLCVRVWIEMLLGGRSLNAVTSHPLREGVD